MMKTRVLVLIVIVTFLSGCSTTYHYQSRAPQVEGEQYVRNSTVLLNGATLYIRPTNGVAKSIYGYEAINSPGYYGGVFNESEATKDHFVMEILVLPESADVNVQLDMIALRINEQTIYPDAYVLGDALRMSSQKYELFGRQFWDLCYDKDNLNFSRYRFNFTGALRRLAKGEKIIYPTGQPGCIALKFPVARPDPRTAVFTLDLSRAVQVVGERQAIKPIQFVPYTSVSHGPLM